MVFNLFSLPLIAAGMIMLALAFLACRLRATKEAKVFSLLALFIAVYILGYALEISSTSLEYILFWLKVEYLGISMIPAFLLIFSLTYSGRGHWLTLPFFSVLFIIPAIILFLMFTVEYHSLYYQHIQLSTEGPFPVISFEWGPWYWVQIIYIGVVILFSNMLFLLMFLTVAPVYRQQYFILLVASLFPWGAHIIYLTGNNSWNLDIAPFALLLTGLLSFLALFRYGILELVPVARSILFEELPDGVFLVDNSLRVVDMNSAAKKYLQVPAHVMGKPVGEVLATWPEITEHLREGSTVDICDTRSMDGKYKINKINGPEEGSDKKKGNKEPGPGISSAGKRIHRSENNGRHKSTECREYSENNVRNGENDRNERNSRNEKFRLQVQRINHEGLSWFDVDFMPLFDGRGSILGKMIVLRDVTERKEAEERILYLSFHDSLTGLYNRAFFNEELKRLDTKRQLPLSIIIGDVNGLKLANDAMGHGEGDRLLMAVARVFKDTCREEDIICRWGGDEFAILLPRLDEGVARKICTRIQTACLSCSDSLIPVSISLGLATKTKEEQEIGSVLQEAEDQMYRDKLLESGEFRSNVLLHLQNWLHNNSYKTFPHIFQMQNLALDFGIFLNLTMEQLDDLAVLAAYYDIGMATIPSSITKKPWTLVPEEQEVVKTHTESGYRIALSTPQLTRIAESILYHHERWDGKGYPRGFKGTEIPLLARILAIVEAYLVITSNRPYRTLRSKEEAIEELKKYAGSQFDPNLLVKFISLLAS